MANNQYCIATNWGKGFITHDDSRDIGFKSHPADVWQIPANNQKANRWIAGVAGVRKTLSEAQAIVDAEIAQMQADYDALPADDPRKDPASASYLARAEEITLEE
tara:strand:+ start:663 stop:977 length:315 start_codon:yes stop_codon:yes gene_type:complete